MSKALPIIITLLAGFMGGFIFTLISAPLPWILGSIFGVIVLSQTPARVHKVPRPYVNVARIIIGIAIGGQFSPAILDDITSYATSLAFLPFYILLVTSCGWFYFHVLMKLDRRTAFLCSTPGGIAELVIVGEDIKANVPQLALIQGVRILVVVYTLPFLAGSLKDMNVGSVKQFMPPLSASQPTALLLLVLIGISGWLIARSLKISGAPIIGPMIFSALLSINNLLPQEPPDEVFKFAQFLLGTSIGSVFFGYSIKDMALTVLKSVGFLFVLAAITGLMAYLITQITDFSFLSALLAYAPGGQAETSIVALVLGENTGYVALHHLARLFVIVSIIPPVARRFYRDRPI
ncbi:MAG: AbrB family transcriptional regulator [Methylocystaceae bacterium]|nr:AbrB family transcriptional regulator [Methylocystaceae bacterium]